MRIRWLLSVVVFTSMAFAQVQPCPVSQSRRLREWLTSPPNPVAPDKQKEVATRAQLDQICLPGGQKAYLVSRGIHPPQILQGKLPDTNEITLLSMGVGEHRVVLRVNEQGNVSAAFLLTEHNTIAQEVTQGFKGWKLTPATFKGAAVPVVFKLTLEAKPQQ